MRVPCMKSTAWGSEKACMMGGGEGQDCARLVIDDLNAKYGLLLAALLKVAEGCLADQLGPDGPFVAVGVERMDGLARSPRSPAARRTHPVHTAPGTLSAVT